MYIYIYIYIFTNLQIFSQHMQFKNPKMSNIFAKQQTCCINDQHFS